MFISFHKCDPFQDCSVVKGSSAHVMGQTSSSLVALEARASCKSPRDFDQSGSVHMCMYELRIQRALQDFSITFATADLSVSPFSAINFALSILVLSLDGYTLRIVLSY